MGLHKIHMDVLKNKPYTICKVNKLVQFIIALHFRIPEDVSFL